jgi:hypothetical protein
MAALDAELRAYRTEASKLEAAYPGKWVIFREASLISIHDSFESAAAEAVSRFGRGPYLIRQIGAPPIVIPASIAYQAGDEDKT